MEVSPSATIESIIAELDLSAWETESHPGREAITFWIPPEHKEKYNLIQRRSKNKFGKFLRELIKTSIDKVKIE